MSGDTQYLWCHLHGVTLENQRYPLRISSLRNRINLNSAEFVKLNNRKLLKDTTLARAEELTIVLTLAAESLQKITLAWKRTSHC